jgi:hypothetical protein
MVLGNLSSRLKMGRCCFFIGLRGEKSLPASVILALIPVWESTTDSVFLQREGG